MTATVMDPHATDDVRGEPAGTRRSTPRSLRVRAMGFAFDQTIPRWWLFGNPYPTHVSNGLNILFPEGERFFIRSVKYYVDRIADDPELLARVRGFFGQEGRHGHEHERYNRILEAQGYDLQPFMRFYKRWAFDFLEKHSPPVLRLSATAALEHYTATLAENGLRTGFMDNFTPVMRDLLKWHAAEEIEHKSVAFDVLQRIDPRWSVRALGMGLASAGLMGFWLVATRSLLEQEAARGTDMEEKRRLAQSDPRLIEERRHRNEMFRKAVIDYLRPDFHPDQNDNYDLARDYLASIGRLDG